MCTAIIGAAIGAVVGAVGYTISTVASGSEFNTGTMLLTAGAGAVAGAVIGSGVGIVAAAASTVTAAVEVGTATTAVATTVIEATGGDPSDEIEATTQAFGNLSQAANYGIQPGTQLQNTLSGTGLQVHHIIEQRLAGALGQTAAEAKNWLSVAVTSGEH